MTEQEITSALFFRRKYNHNLGEISVLSNTTAEQGRNTEMAQEEF